MHDLRLAARTLARTPISTAFIVALLGLGLGANATIFTVFDAILLRPLAVPHPEQLVRMVQRLPKLPARSNFEYPYYEALRDHASTLQFAFGETDDGIHLRMTEPAFEQVSVHAVTPEFFQALRAKPYWGRVLTNDIDAAVLSYPFWRKHFSDDPRAMAGKTVLLNGHRLAIVGVMPLGFHGISVDTSPDIRVPLKACPVLLDCNVESVSLELAGRLKPGVSERSAEQECLAIWNSVMRDYYLNTDKISPAAAAVYLKRGMNLETLARGTSVLRDRASDVLKLLMAAVTLLVFIIGLNVAGLLVARTAARRQEMALKLAIGASPLRLAWQMTLESFVLAAGSCVVAVLVALTMTPVAMRLVPPVRSLYTTVVPLSVDVRMNARVLLFLALMTMGTALVFTIGPVLASLRVSIDSVLRTVRSGGGLRGRQVLIAAQMALCTFLLVGAGQLSRSFQQLANTPSGFARDSVATFTCDLEEYKGAPAVVQKLKERILQLPGVVSVATANIGVMREHGQFGNVAPAGQRLGRAEFMATNVNHVSPEYFNTMGIRMLSGRDFTSVDTPKPTKAIVNEAFARRFFPGRDPLGQQFGTAMEGFIAQPDFEIIGVVNDTKYRSLKDPVRPMYFAPQTDFESFVLNVRTSNPPEAIIGPVQQTAASVAPDLPFLEVNTLAREVAETTSPERTTALVSSLFGIVAALLAGVGTYGLLTYAVRQRRREIGIRLALGAQRADVMKLIARHTLGMTGTGAVAGLAAAFLAGPAIRSVLYGLSEADPVPFVGAGIFVAVVAMVAMVGPVLHATSIRPAEALRV